MSTKQNLIGVVNVESSTDLSGSQFLFVTASGALAAANGGDALGVMQDAIDASTNGPKAIPVGYLGISKVLVDGNSENISVGSRITSDAAGKGVTKSPFGATDNVLGIAMEASTADGDIISVLLVPLGTIL